MFRSPVATAHIVAVAGECDGNDYRGHSSNQRRARWLDRDHLMVQAVRAHALVEIT